MTFAIAVENYGRVIVVEGNALLYMFRLVGQSRLPCKGLPANQSSIRSIEQISTRQRSGARSTIPLSLRL